MTDSFDTQTTYFTPLAHVLNKEIIQDKSVYRSETGINLVSLITGILITGLDFYTLGYAEGTLQVAQGPRATTCILVYL